MNQRVTVEQSRFTSPLIQGEVDALGRVSDALEQGYRELTGQVVRLTAELEAARLARRAANGTLDPESINGDVLSAELLTAGMPNPDLIIRTSGESRLSNFMLWQGAYSELYFTDVLWPDFTREHMQAAIAHYAERERRFGLVSASAETD